MHPVNVSLHIVLKQRKIVLTRNVHVNVSSYSILYPFDHSSSENRIH
jgi:hypothetical protein